jgi:hypothetical protein
MQYRQRIEPPPGWRQGGQQQLEHAYFFLLEDNDRYVSAGLYAKKVSQKYHSGQPTMKIK